MEAQTQMSERDTPSFRFLASMISSSNPQPTVESSGEEEEEVAAAAAVVGGGARAGGGAVAEAWGGAAGEGAGGAIGRGGLSLGSKSDLLCPTLSLIADGCPPLECSWTPSLSCSMNH